MIERRLEFGTAHWRDFAGTSKEELEKLASEYGLNSEMVRDCLDPAHLPKLERSPRVSFLMLRAYDETSAEDASSIQDITRKVAIFMGENFVLTFHRVPLKWMDGVWDHWERKAKREPHQLAALLEDVVEECLYTFEEPIDQAALSIDKLEDNIFHNGQAPVA